MNKALYILVYFFLILAGTSLFFEIQLNGKRAALTDRNRMQEDYLVRIARTVEKTDAPKQAVMELKKDASPVEAKIVDSPEQENVLDDYNASLEQANLETYNWENSASREQLRTVYMLDEEGKPVMDGNEPLKKGRGTEDELLSQLFESAKLQQSRLNTTRAELVTMRGKLEGVVNELNGLKPIARQDKVTIVEKNEQIQKLENEKAELENEIAKQKNQIGELNTEIASLNTDLSAAKDEVEQNKEEIAKKEKLIEQLKKLLQEAIQAQGNRSSNGGSAVTSISAGNKGKLIEVDNTNMFAIVEFTPDAMKELKGNNPNAALPALELGLRRPGFNGPAGEFIGRIRLRQEVKGKPYVICDLLGSWEQATAEVGDVVYSD